MKTLRGLIALGVAALFAAPLTAQEAGGQVGGSACIYNAISCGETWGHYMGNGGVSFGDPYHEQCMYCMEFGEVVYYYQCHG